MNVSDYCVKPNLLSLCGDILIPYKIDECKNEY